MLKLVQKELPDGVLLDIEIPEIDGLTLTKQISSDFPLIKVIILSTHLGTEYVAKALDLGAKGYISKCAISKDLSLLIQLVYRGYSSIKYDLIDQVIKSNRQVIKQYQEQVKQLKYRQQLIQGNHTKSKHNKLFIKLRIITKYLIMSISKGFFLQKINVIIKKGFNFLFKSR